MKCVKCKKSINCEDGFYNYPSGAMHSNCGKEKSKKLEALRKTHGLGFAVMSESFF